MITGRTPPDYERPALCVRRIRSWLIGDCPECRNGTCRE